MNIIKTLDGASLLIKLEGRLDTPAAPELDQVLKASLSGVSDLCFDFSQLDYLSSAGLRVLISAQKTMNRQGRMKLTHVNDMLMEIFEVTGFSQFLTIE